MKIFRNLALLLSIPIIFILACSRPAEIPAPPAPPAPPVASITVDKTSLNVPSGFNKDSIIITSTEPWNLSIPLTAPWINADSTSGKPGTSKVYLTHSANTTTSLRTAIISITSTGATLNPITINVTQDQPDVKIISFTAHAPGGTIITINGTGFSPIANENIVKINGVNVLVNNATTTLLTVTIPPRVGSGPVQVSVNTKSDTSRYDFIYDWLGTVTIIAGGIEGFADGTGTEAKFTHPAGLDIDALGNLYVADYANSKVRKVTPGGVVTTFPGRFPAWNNPTGPNTDFGLPQDVAIDGNGNIYVAEVNSNAISKISSTGTVTLVAGGIATGYVDGPAAQAQFWWPTGIDVDPSGNLIVAEISNHKIRKITPSGIVSTLAGGIQSYADGTGTAALFNMPFNVTSDGQGNFLITDYFNNRVRKITPSGVVTTFAGTGGWDSTDGTLLTASIYKPTDIAIDASGNIYLCDGNSKIRWLTPAGKVYTINTNISFNVLQGIAVDNNGNVFVSDYNNNRICKVTIQ